MVQVKSKGPLLENFMYLGEVSLLVCLALQLIR